MGYSERSGELTLDSGIGDVRRWTDVKFEPTAGRSRDERLGTCRNSMYRRDENQVTLKQNKMQQERIKYLSELNKELARLQGCGRRPGSRPS